MKTPPGQYVPDLFNWNTKICINIKSCLPVYILSEFIQFHASWAEVLRCPLFQPGCRPQTAVTGLEWLMPDWSYDCYIPEFRIPNSLFTSIGTRRCKWLPFPSERAWVKQCSNINGKITRNKWKNVNSPSHPNWATSAFGTTATLVRCSHPSMGFRWSNIRENIPPGQLIPKRIKTLL